MQETIYETFLRPSWAPPSWVFGVVWPFLYALIAVSYGYIMYQAINFRKYTIYQIMPFLLNLIANFTFTYAQFRLLNYPLAWFLVGAVWVTIVATIVILWRDKKWLLWMQIPYLLWVSFAWVLQTSVTLLNT